MGQENLRGVLAVLAEARLPGLHQAHLAQRGGGLQLVHRTRSGGPAQLAHARGHGPGRDQHQLHACLTQRDHLLDPNGHGTAVEAFAIGGQQSTANLHDPALGARHLASHLLPTYVESVETVDTKTPLLRAAFSVLQPVSRARK
ncbi:hypothetical protein D3C71_1352610 [compost metagenome]